MITLLDPQTGHYNTELLMAPEMLGEPKVLTGADNAISGFNSNAGTVSYSWSEITKGGSLTIGGGDHNLNFQRLHHAITGAYGNSKDWTWGAEIEASRSESDGTIPLGITLLIVHPAASNCLAQILKPIFSLVIRISFMAGLVCTQQKVNT